MIYLNLPLEHGDFPHAKYCSIRRVKCLFPDWTSYSTATDTEINDRTAHHSYQGSFKNSYRRHYYPWTQNPHWPTHQPLIQGISAFQLDLSSTACFFKLRALRRCICREFQGLHFRLPKLISAWWVFILGVPFFCWRVLRIFSHSLLSTGDPLLTSGDFGSVLVTKHVWLWK